MARGEFLNRRRKKCHGTIYTYTPPPPKKVDTQQCTKIINMMCKKMMKIGVVFFVIRTENEGLIKNEKSDKHNLIWTLDFSKWWLQYMDRGRKIKIMYDI